MTKINVRDDDILIPSSAYSDPLDRFKEVHDIICFDEKFLHVPAILCADIEKFSDAINFIERETKEGRMAPELHGWNHIDYGKMTEKEIDEDLSKCLDWFNKALKLTPKLFYTPWAGESEIISSVSKKLGLEAVGGKKNFIEPHKYLNKLYPLEPGCTIAMHWWKNGDVKHLRRIIIEKEI